MHKDQIVQEISEYMSKNPIPSCYVGITSNLEKRLFDDHKVSEDGNHWISCDAKNNPEAHAIKKYFLEKGMDGEAGAVDYNSTIVYCYKKTMFTNP